MTVHPLYPHVENGIKFIIFFQESTHNCSDNLEKLRSVFRFSICFHACAFVESPFRIVTLPKKPIFMTLTVLYEDNHLLVVRKPSGMLSQGDQTGDPNLLDVGKAYLKEKYDKPGNVFLGLVHRLDRPVSGVMVFARTSKSAARLSEQIRDRTIHKQYWALAEGRLPKSGQLAHHLAHRQSKSRVVSPPEGQHASLSYRCINYHNNISWLEIQLETGRHHQIRVQFAHIGHALIGDYKYGSRKPYPHRSLALHALSLSFTHPITQESMIFKADPDPHWYTTFENVAPTGSRQ